MAKKLKLSPWHDGRVKPVHVGWYQCYGCFAEIEDCFAGKKGIVWRRWNGKNWIWKDIDNFNYMSIALVGISDKWRGIND